MQIIKQLHNQGKPYYIEIDSFHVCMIHIKYYKDKDISCHLNFLSDLAIYIRLDSKNKILSVEIAYFWGSCLNNIIWKLIPDI